MTTTQKHISNAFLEAVNMYLKQIVQIAMSDFVAVNSLLKNFYEKRATSEKILPAEVAIKIEAMTSCLQYMDIFKQRVDHLICTHESILATDMASRFKESFFHLHAFQSMTIELDLLRSISTIKIILNDLRKYLAIGDAELISESYFTQTSAIKRILQGTIQALKAAGGDIRHLQIPSLTADQLRLLNSMYTMESERVVLNWFLHAMPNGTWNDLHQYYENAIHNVLTDNTELF